MPVASSHYQFQDSYFMVIHPFAYIVIGAVVLVGCVPDDMEKKMTS